MTAAADGQLDLFASVGGPQTAPQPQSGIQNTTHPFRTRHRRRSVRKADNPGPVPGARWSASPSATGPTAGTGRTAARTPKRQPASHVGAAGTVPDTDWAGLSGAAKRGAYGTPRASALPPWAGAAGANVACGRPAMRHAGALDYRYQRPGSWRPR